MDGGDLVRQAGLEKCRGQGTLSLADCFALALTRSRAAQLITTDSELAKAAGKAGRLVRVG